MGTRLNLGCGTDIRGGILVENASSLLSAGTERSKIKLAHSNLLDKARQRPDQVGRVLNNLHQEGLIPSTRRWYLAWIPASPWATARPV